MSRAPWVGLALAILLLVGGGAWMLASGREERSPSRLERIRTAAEKVAGPRRVSVVEARGQQTELLVKLPREQLSVIVATRELDIEERIPPKGDDTLSLFNDRLAMTYPETRAGKCLEQQLMKLEGVSYKATSPIAMDDPSRAVATARYC